MSSHATPLQAEHDRLRDETDPDPIIEELVARLRDSLGSLYALDEWGRPLAWRQVVRLAVGPTAARLRDAETAVALAEAASRVAREDDRSAPVTLSH